MASMDETFRTTAAPGGLLDLLVVGGGVNGTGIARDAAGRGASVLLVEQDDLASHTSSASTKLIHGGLRYLEYYEFRLVREALIEREKLLRIAPHIIWPMRFVLPYTPQARPAWMLRLGLFLYDHLAPNMTLPKCKSLDFRTSSAGQPLNGKLARGFAYSDGWVQDSRLVVLNAMDAKARGADIRTRTRMVAARRVNGVWEVDIENMLDGTKTTVRARVLVNAGGPWVSEVLRERAQVESTKNVRLVKGSHIVVPRLFDGPQAYILQNPDKRIVFAIPYEQKFTLIGTTDVPWTQAPGDVEISPEEISYLCESVSRYFTKPVTPADVVWSYAGVRPLYDDAAKNASAVTRDYVLDVDTQGNQAPMLSIFGGKITTYRRLAEHAIEKLQPFLPVLSAPGWTADKVLPGGDLGEGGFEGALGRLRAQAPFLGADLSWRLVRNYGSRATEIVGDAHSMEDMGELFGAGLSVREVEYLIANEWAQTTQDILWRRSRLGLHVTDEDTARLEAYLKARKPGTAPTSA